MRACWLVTFHCESAVCNCFYMFFLLKYYGLFSNPFLSDKWLGIKVKIFGWPWLGLQCRRWKPYSPNSIQNEITASSFAISKLIHKALTLNYSFFLFDTVKSTRKQNRRHFRPEKRRAKSERARKLHREISRKET